MYVNTFRKKKCAFSSTSIVRAMINDDDEEGEEMKAVNKWETYHR